MNMARLLLSSFFIGISAVLEGQVVINEVMINAGNCDGSCMPNTGEWTEFYNNSNAPVDISCFVMTDGDWSVTFPPGTILAPFDFYVVGSPNSAATIDLDIGTCNCTSTNTSGISEIGIFTNGNEQLVLANTSGTIVNGIFWGIGQFSQTPSFTTDALLGCPSITVNLTASDPNLTSLSGGGADQEVVALDCDGIGNWVVSVPNSTPNASNSNPVVFNANPIITSQSCSSLGSIALNPTGGVGPFTYNWQGTLSGNITSSAANLSAGNYSVLITDQGQCAPPQTFNFTVGSTNTPTLSVSASNTAICAGESTILTANGGSNYVWNNTPELNTLNGSVVIATPTSTATYTVQSNSNGCNEIQNITITVTTPPVLNAFYNAPLCEGEDLQLSSATIIGANYSWSGPSAFVSNLSSPLLANISATEAGDYTVTVQLGPCTVSEIINVGVNVPIPTVIDPIGPLCVSELPLDLISTNAPGTWNGNGIIDPLAGTFDPNAAQPGTHTIQFQSDAFCTAVASIDITVLDVMDATILAAGPFCINDGDYPLQTNTAGGSWSGTGVNSSGIVSPFGLGSGNFDAIYSFSGSCGDSDTVNIVIFDNPQPQIIGQNLSGCSPIAGDFMNTNFGANDQCTWSIDGAAASSNCSSFQPTISQPGCHDVTLQITNSAGCTATDSLPNIICIDSDPNAQFEWSPTTPTLSDNLVFFHNLSSGNVQNLWEINGTNFTNPDISYTVPNEITTSFLACLTVQGNYGCVDSICYTIAVQNEILLYIPNSFTPNEDPINNGFGPSIYGIPLEDLNYHFSIFSRNGDRVFYSEDPLQKWDGDVHHGDYYGMSTLYEWRLEMAPKWEADPEIFKGFVILLR
jgi:Lamin Tail Domain/CHU_C Type IX secretion signal domain